MSHKLYGRNYILVYLMAATILLANILATDMFLDNQFLGYVRNVMIHGKYQQDLIFPKLSKCDFYR